MRHVLLATLLCASTGAHAQSPDDPGYERIVKSPPTQEEIEGILLVPTVTKGISYIGGGVGSAERAAIEQWAKGYTLRIEMARKSGEYLGDMQVRIFDAQGETVLEAPSDGPLFFVQLPAGRYAVEIAPLDPPAPSTAGLAPQIREVTVTEGQQARVFLAWP